MQSTSLLCACGLRHLNRVPQQADTQRQASACDAAEVFAVRNPIKTSILSLDMASLEAEKPTASADPACAESGVRVAVRVRPTLAHETGRAGRTVTFVRSRHAVQHEESVYGFSACLGPHATQHDVFDSLGLTELVPRACNGVSSTVLAYGQTGSGKTHTMGLEASHGRTIEAGAPGEGVLPRVCRQVAQTLQATQAAVAAGLAGPQGLTHLSVSVSFLEVYNGTIRDLLQGPTGAGQVSLRRTASGATQLTGATSADVAEFGDFQQLLARGLAARATGSTPMSPASSRSHAIFTIALAGRQLLVDGQERQVHAHIRLVDLAGSERQKKTQASGAQLTESIGINQGLLALGNVIVALSDGEGHIPYRDSKLTRLLQDSLGGQSHTVFIACVGPAACNAHETHSTLRYARRVLNISNHPAARLAPVPLPGKQVSALKPSPLEVAPPPVPFAGPHQPFSPPPPSPPARTLADCGTAADRLDEVVQWVVGRGEALTPRQASLAAHMSWCAACLRGFHGHSWPTPPQLLDERERERDDSVARELADAGRALAGMARHVQEAKAEAAAMQADLAAARSEIGMLRSALATAESSSLSQLQVPRHTPSKPSRGSHQSAANPASCPPSGNSAWLAGEASPSGSCSKASPASLSNISSIGDAFDDELETSIREAMQGLDSAPTGGAPGAIRSLRKRLAAATVQATLADSSGSSEETKQHWQLVEQLRSELNLATAGSTGPTARGSPLAAAATPHVGSDTEAQSVAEAVGRGADLQSALGRLSSPALARAIQRIAEIHADSRTQALLQQRERRWAAKQARFQALLDSQEQLLAARNPHDTLGLIRPLHFPREDDLTSPVAQRLEFSQPEA